MRAVILTGAPSLLSAHALLESARSGEMHPMEALNQLVAGGEIEIREATPEELALRREPSLIDLATEIGLSAQAFRGPPTPRRVPTGRSYAQQVEYTGAKGRAKVTFGDAEAIVSRLKLSGSWKVVARHPWPESGTDCRVNATLQDICGPDFQAKES